MRPDLLARSFCGGQAAQHGPQRETTRERTNAPRSLPLPPRGAPRGLYRQREGQSLETGPPARSCREWARAAPRHAPPLASGLLFRRAGPSPLSVAVRPLPGRATRRGGRAITARRTEGRVGGHCARPSRGARAARRCAEEEAAAKPGRMAWSALRADRHVRAWGRGRARRRPPLRPPTGT
eukprot:scaffold2939_cov406-Prasinococcus_capsulatus_cf.AAC.12